MPVQWFISRKACPTPNRPLWRLAHGFCCGHMAIPSMALHVMLVCAAGNVSMHSAGRVATAGSQAQRSTARLPAAMQPTRKMRRGRIVHKRSARPAAARLSCMLIKEKPASDISVRNAHRSICCCADSTPPYRTQRALFWGGASAHGDSRRALMHFQQSMRSGRYS